jgi:DNA polymerase elongation subunit (family B)/predicted RNA-binding Zn-ribbon protein involved in translation (DUF1610 family)
MKTLLIDIETAPNKVYTWGLFGQNISLNQIEEPGYTICFAAKWLNKDKIIFKSVHHQDEETMLFVAHDLMSEADAIIHYNGNNFDIPVLNSEFLKHGMNPPAPSNQVDLLKAVRRNFRLTSNKLDFVARHLGIEGKLEHKGMDLWSGCMAGDAASWKTMKAYNIQDVLLLEQVYDRLLPWIDDHPNMALYSDSKDAMCPSCGSDQLQRRGTQKAKTMEYQRYQCTACGGWSRARTTMLSKEKRKNVLVKI